MMAARGLRDAVVIFVVTLNGQNNWQRQHLALFKPSLTAPCGELLMRPDTIKIYRLMIWKHINSPPVRNKQELVGAQQSSAHYANVLANVTPHSNCPERIDRLLPFWETKLQIPICPESFACNTAAPQAIGSNCFFSIWFYSPEPAKYIYVIGVCQVKMMKKISLISEITLWTFIYMFLQWKYQQSRFVFEI